MYFYLYNGKKCNIFSILTDQMVRLWTVSLDIFYVAQLAIFRRKRFLITCVKLGKGEVLFLAVPILLHFCRKIRWGGNSVLPIHDHPRHRMQSVTAHKEAAWCGLNPVYVQAVSTLFIHIWLAVVRGDFF